VCAQQCVKSFTPKAAKKANKASSKKTFRDDDDGLELGRSNLCTNCGRSERDHIKGTTREGGSKFKIEFHRFFAVHKGSGAQMVDSVNS